MGLASRLYRGETNIDFIGSRKRWYLTSVVLILLCFASMGIRGFNWGIEFSGGTSFVFPATAGSTLGQVEEVVEDTGVQVQTAQEAGRGAQAKYVLRTESLGVEETGEVKKALTEALDLPADSITDNVVSSSWGDQVTRKALIALAVFLVVVAIYLAFRFETKMAIAALLALLHDLLLTAGAYSMIGFEVTPSTIVGLLTILGFSLYDTVVVFDKVEENTRGIQGGSRITYGEASNAAVNETLMRSINTSLISLLPVAGLLFVGAGLLGVGTLKDLALVLFVGLAAGAYSSLFLATPWLVDMKEREPRYAALKERVHARRLAAAHAAAKEAKAAKAAARTGSGASTESAVTDDATESDPDGEEPDEADRAVAAAGAPRGGGSPPAQRRRSGGKPGRPSGSRKRR